MHEYPDDFHDFILRMVPADGKVIGTIGCGKAGTESVLVKEGREVHGVDVSDEAIEIAKTRLTSARVVNPDDRAPFLENSLDGLILADVLEHVPLAWEALQSYTRAVKPGGWVVISVPNMRSMAVFVRFFVQGDWPEKSVGIFDKTHIQMMSRKRLERWCTGSGLVIERWFDRYEPHRWRGPLFKWLDLITLRFFHEFFTFQHQCLARKPA